jgi:glycosyltransferase involved in cell wall biosynthesis
MPLVSVLLPVYNDARYVELALNSILSQTLGDLELIVIIDGSSDGTPEIVSRFRDPRIRLVHNERNLGLAPSLNRGIAAAKGDYIARQDADDIALPHRLRTQIEFLRSHSDVAMVGSWALLIDDQGREQGVLDYPPIADIDIKWSLLFRNPFIHSSVMMRRDVVDRTGGYTEDPVIFRAFVEDYDLWSRINRVARSANIREPLQVYRLNSMSASARTRCEQSRQTHTIAQRNMCWLLDWSTMDVSCWEGLYRFLYHPPQQPLDWTTSEALRTMAFFDAVYSSFCGRYRFSKSEIHEHRARVFRWWARHALSLSFRKNGNRSLLCRLALLRWGASLTGRVAVSEFAGALERTRYEGKCALST